MKMARKDLLYLIAVLFNISQTSGHFIDIGQENHIEVCEGKTVSLGCKNGGVINVVKALYGRLNRKQCSRYFALFNTNCRSPVSMEKVKAKCQGKSHCILTASNNVFGNPCLGTYKYLEVTYKCVQPGNMEQRN